MKSSSKEVARRYSKNSLTYARSSATSTSRLLPARTKTAAKRQATRKFRIQTSRSLARYARPISVLDASLRSDMGRLADLGKDVHAGQLGENAHGIGGNSCGNDFAHDLGVAIDQKPVHHAFHPAARGI